MTADDRQREIDQGLREPSGALIGGLDVLDYAQGHKDFEAGTPPPKGITSVSYDLGRHRAAEKAEQKADLLREIEERNAASRAKVRELIAHRPDLLAEYDAKMSDHDSGAATVRNLAAHDLVTWDGGAFDPERKAVLTERGKFVLKHGQRS